MAPYPIFFRALKTIIMPNFMLLTESEQLKHISALLLMIFSTNFEADRTWIKSPRKLKKAEEKKEEKEEILMLYIE